MPHKNRIQSVALSFGIAVSAVMFLLWVWQPSQAAGVSEVAYQPQYEEGTIEWAGGYTVPFMQRPFRINSNPANDGARLDHDSIGTANDTMSGTYRDGDHYSSVTGADIYCPGFRGTLRTTTSPCLSYDSHSGYDYPMFKGTAIYPVAPGYFVYHGGTNDPNAYGEVKHDLDDDGIIDYVTWYVHVSERVAPDGPVSVNDIIARSGCLEYVPTCTNEHLHLTIRRNVQLPDGTYQERYTDPYGWWNSEIGDPLIDVPNGVESQWLWIDTCPHENTTGPFCDILESSSLFNFVNLLAKGEITDGCTHYGDNYFYCPDHTITRGQMAKFVMKASEFIPNISCGDFSDVPPTHTFYEAITTLKCEEIVSGVNGNFFPDQPITRGELSQNCCPCSSLYSEWLTRTDTAQWRNHWGIT
ncbi:MAG: S-layer homology domain-containing protein [Candidatus Promineifilaceae bacterium]